MSLVEAYERVGKSVILVCKNPQKGQMIHFIPLKESRKRAGFVIHSFLKGRKGVRARDGASPYKIFLVPPLVFDSHDIMAMTVQQSYRLFFRLSFLY